MRKTRFEGHILPKVSNGTFLLLKPGASGSILCGTEYTVGGWLKVIMVVKCQANSPTCPCESICPPEITSTGSFTS